MLFGDENAGALSVLLGEVEGGAEAMLFGDENAGSLSVLLGKVEGGVEAMLFGDEDTGALSVLLGEVEGGVEAMLFGDENAGALSVLLGEVEGELGGVLLGDEKSGAPSVLLVEAEGEVGGAVSLGDENAGMLSVLLGEVEGELGTLLPSDEDARDATSSDMLAVPLEDGSGIEEDGALLVASVNEPGTDGGAVDVGNAAPGTNVTVIRLACCEGSDCPDREALEESSDGADADVGESFSVWVSEFDAGAPRDGDRDRLKPSSALVEEGPAIEVAASAVCSVGNADGELESSALL